MPFELSRKGLTLQLLFQTLMISTLVVLWHSTANSGLPLPSLPATTSFNTSARSLLHSGYSLLWTTLPAIIIGLYAKFYSGMVDKLKNSQPMIELLNPPRPAGPNLWKRRRRDKSGSSEGVQPKRSTVERTLLLDYRVYLPGVDSWHAMLLQGSPDVAEYIEAVKQHASNSEPTPEESDLVEYAKKEPRLHECDCWVDTADGTIRVQRPDKEGFLEYYEQGE